MQRGLTGHYEITQAGGETIYAFIPNPLPPTPPLDLNQVCERTKLSFPAASRATQNLQRLNIVHEITGQRRNRVFAYIRYLEILSEGIAAL